MRWFLPLVLLMACEPAPEDTGDPASVASGPEVSWEVPASLAEGADLELEVTVVDPDADTVSSVIAFYRRDGLPVWDQVSLTNTEGDSWSATVPGEDVEAPSLELYFRAEDASVYEAVAFTPTGGDDDPYVLPVDVEGASLPWTEDFEQGEDADSLYDLSWSDYQAAFAGYPWDITSSKAHEGDWSLLHRRGYEDMDVMDDWAVTPPLDLSGVDRIQLTWWEYGSTVDDADHELYISTGSPDPEDEEFELVTALEAPVSGEWSRSALVDLTAWSGQSPVYVAWRYQGSYVDTWYIDDVQVRELTADLDVTDVTWSPDPASPGDSVTVSVAVENLTDVAAEGVTWTPTVDESLGSFAGAVSQDVDGDGTATLDLVLTVDDAFPDNAYLPFSLEATDGDSTWTFDDLTITVGEASVATLTFTVSDDSGDTADTGVLDEANVAVTLGVGDPDDPTLEVEVLSEQLAPDTYTETLDVTDYYDYLPPAPGDTRWWVRFEMGAVGTLDAFSLAYGGESLSSDDLGDIASDEEVVFYLPRPPEPVIDSDRTAPEVVAPGDTVSWTVNLQNIGADTTGVTEVELTSSDDSVTLIDGGPFVLGDVAGWPEDGTGEVTFTLAVGSDHDNSQPVRLELEVTDEVETFTVEGAVDVPWPVFEVTSIGIDDDGGDEILDEDEAAVLDIELSNLGDLDSFGKVTCDMAQTGGTATVTVDLSDGSFGSIDAGDSEDDDDFELTVTAGAAGDDVDLQLSCEDDDATYTVDFELILGEAPWSWMATEYDLSGDAQDEPFDFRKVLYRYQDGVLWFELESWEEIDDEGDLFIEAWMSSTGSSYSYYNLVYQYGNGSWRGYDSGVWTTFDDPEAELIDSTTLRLGVTVDDIGLAVDGVEVGWGSGFCGGTEQFCDHYPDGWGSPYQGWSPSLWYDVDW